MSRNSDDRIVYVSCTEGGYEVLRNLLRLDHEISAIVSLTPEQAEEHGVSGYQSFEDVATREEIPLHVPEQYDLKTTEDRSLFEALDADLLIVNGWQRLIPGDILATVTRGALGVHGSAFGLPKGRGRSPMNWSLIEDLDRFLLSVLKLDENVDAGGIVDTVKYDVNEHDDIRTLYFKLVVATTQILDENLDAVLAGTCEIREQSGTPTYYPKRTPEDGAIDWAVPTREVYNLVRAVTRPYPGAFTSHEGTRIEIWGAQPFSDDFRFDVPPGTVVQRFVTAGAFVVKTADGTLLVTDWEAEDEWEPEEGLAIESLADRGRVDAPREDGHE